MKFALLILLILLFPENAYAYLDPGSGSYFFQIILGVLLGGLISLKVFWKKVKSLVIRSIQKLPKIKN